MTAAPLPAEAHPKPPEDQKPVRYVLPFLTSGLLIVGMIVVLALMGRLWWCACGRWFLWTSETGGQHNSQHLGDPYIFSHLLHGVVFYWLINWSFEKHRWPRGLVVAMILETAWEVFENTPFVINKYREGTAAIGYTGDTIANSTVDALACVVGYFLARGIGWKWSVLVYIVLEVGCAIWVKDNLTLNVIMLLYPIDAIKQWQSS